jgi:hypothetical protein
MPSHGLSTLGATRRSRDGGELRQQDQRGELGFSDGSLGEHWSVTSRTGPPSPLTGPPHRGLVDLEFDRLSQWLFARCVQESIDHPDLGEMPPTSSLTLSPVAMISEAIPVGR